MAECILGKREKKNLIIIGGGIEQVPAYKLAKRRGLTIIGTDINDNAPALKLADHCLIASTRDPKTTLVQVKKFAKNQKIHGVMTIANDVALTVSTISNSLNLPGISLEAATKVSDKLLMKNAFKLSSVPTPWFAPIKNLDELKKILLSSNLNRFVIKPSDGRGARGVLLIDRNTDLKWVFSEAKKYGSSGKLILEEFVNGLQLSTESFLINGKVFTPAISERNYEHLERFFPYFIENGGTIPANLTNHMKNKIDKLISDGARALGVNEGIVKGDIVIKSDGTPMIIELALRLSGGWLSSHQIPAATGVNLVDIVISHALGKKIATKSLFPKKKMATAIRYWFPKPGKIKKIIGENKLKKLKGLITYGFLKNTGNIQKKVKMHADRFGYIIVSAKNRKDAMKQVNKGIEMIKIIT